jgi:hypothetical protein
MVEYFEKTYINGHLYGWVHGFLGIGCPSTNNAVESSWRTLSAWSNAKTHAKVCLRKMLNEVVPYYVRRVKTHPMLNKRTLNLDDRSAAVLLLAHDTAKVEYGHQGEVKWYCRCRISGVRPTITTQEVQRYIQIRKPADIKFGFAVCRSDTVL